LLCKSASPPALKVTACGRAPNSGCFVRESGLRRGKLGPACPQSVPAYLPRKTRPALAKVRLKAGPPRAALMSLASFTGLFGRPTEVYAPFPVIRRISTETIT
jgi:hypothetical protein